MFNKLKSLLEPTQAETSAKEFEDLVIESVTMESIKEAFLSEDDSVVLESAYGEEINNADSTEFEMAFESVCAEIEDELGIVVVE